MKNVVIIDDDAALCRSLELQLSAEGYCVRTATRAQSGLALLEERLPHVLFQDLTLPDGSGLDILRELLNKYPELPIVIITGRQDMKAAISAMRDGAFDYLRKPFDFDDILIVLEKVARKYSAKNEIAKINAAYDSPQPYEIIGSHKSIIDILKQIGLLAQSQVNVLIQGESGTGKELVARALHQATSPGKPFVAVNCSAVVPTLLESELFGHEKGAFTGADRQKIGKLELAKDGTIFFDEIGDLNLDLQVKLLRVLQEREFERVGGDKAISLKARALFATHRDLRSMVQQGTFREDLFYRIAVAEIEVPPLRERHEDIPLLANHFMSTLAERLHKPGVSIEHHAMQTLESYPWPGNIRELENVLTRAVALSQSGRIMAEDIAFPLVSKSEEVQIIPEQIVPLSQKEKEYISHALNATHWNITHTARQLEISPTTLRKKIQDYQIDRP